MSTNLKRMTVIGAGVLAVAALAFVVLQGADELPVVGAALKPQTCPLTGKQPKNDAALDRPAVALKIENSPAAYPLSGLEDADVVYEEVVEGGLTRFLAIYHCGDADKAGPIRSARAVDPAIMTPTARILGFSGANAPVRAALEKADIVLVDESAADGAMHRIPRPGVSVEHTLYADTAAVRRLGSKKFDDPPPDGFEFGRLEGKGKPAKSVEIAFSGGNAVTYAFEGGAWKRSQNGAAFVTEEGERIEADNVLIEEHRVDFSGITDVAGNPSVEIVDVVGSGRAVLLRDGRAVEGRWVRDSLDGPIRFETRSGDGMVFAPGSVWVELVPSQKGDVKGSFSYER